ncbi:nuclease-related domain-containing protein [Alkalihalobacillus deserti]|uniref:nuclease-related domain-containing protein n=1 Tax=Alkalihalobacillus deserti TaxID=2879466 RepID=UPI001D1599BC|nr:nuclease-related domain-containing protein [Alkalihalobacillus deserti]
MIKKELKIPLEVEQLRALLRRLPSNHPKHSLIEEKFATGMAGYRGEQSLDYYLNLLEPRKFFAFHDLRLFHQSSYFQIDLLLLSPCYFFIIEVKNIKGTIYFDDKFDQMIRILDGKETGFPNPLVQVSLQQEQFVKWLSNHKFPPVAVETLVVISHPSTIIKSSHSDPRLKQLIHNANLPSKIKQFDHANKMEKLSTKDLRKLTSLLLKHHTPKTSNILQKFNLSETDLLSGVHCPICYFVPMRRKHGLWNCPQCHLNSKDAHLNAIKDYSLLISETITNKQLRGFLQLTSRSISAHLLKKMNLKSTGVTKGSVYLLSQDG